MPVTTSTWYFNLTFWPVAICAVFLGASLWFFFRSLRVEGRSRGMVALHVLRLALAGLVAATLLKPERVLQTRRTEQPRLGILWDASSSMNTRDVVNGVDPPQRRADWLRQRLESKFWEPLAGRYQISVLPFSEAPADPKTVPADQQIGSDLNAPLVDHAKQFSDLRAVLMLTDGDWNVGQTPVIGAAALKTRDIPIYAVGIGSEQYLPDVEVQTVSAPSYSLLNERVSIYFSVQNHLAREVRTAITVEGPGGALGKKEIILPAQGQVQESILITPTQEGEADYTLRMPLEREDVFPDNNERVFHLAVRKEVLKVLVVDSQPRWEFRYLRNALSRDPGVDLSCVLYQPGLGMGEGKYYLNAFPATKEELQAYDVIFLGDVGIGGGQLTAENAVLIKGLVERQASGIVFVPGMLGFQKTLAGSVLDELLPVELDYSKNVLVPSSGESRFDLTFRGRDHWLTLLAGDPAANQLIWRNLPGFYWHAPVTRARPGAEVLAVHDQSRNQNGRIPLLVTRSFGSGKVLFMGTDSAWRWRKGVEDTYHYRFWGQVVRWMSHQRHLAQEDGVRFFHSPEAPRRGDKVRLNATILDKTNVPVAEGKVRVILTAPSGQADTVELTPEEGGWGVNTGDFIPREGGDYSVEVLADTAGRRLKTQMAVTVPTVEKEGRPAQNAILREITALTTGKLGGTADLESIVKSINLLPEPKPEEQRFRLWSDPWWCGALLVLFSVYWAGRKLVGLA